MENLNKIEEEFMKELNSTWLRFNNPEVEGKYRAYKLSEKKAPLWFKWIMWSLAALITLRRALLIVEATYFPSTVTSLQIRVEVTTTCLLLPTLLIEVLAILIKPLAIIKGFFILVAWFFTVSYSSYNYFPNMIATIPM